MKSDTLAALVTVPTVSNSNPFSVLLNPIGFIGFIL